jgi:glutaredoxin-related protein
VKCTASLLLILFVSFLSTPTVVTLIEKSADIAVFYSFSEEEIHKDITDVNDFKHTFDYPFMESELITGVIIISENLSKHDYLTEEIFAPPPNSI